MSSDVKPIAEIHVTEEEGREKFTIIRRNSGNTVTMYAGDGLYLPLIEKLRKHALKEDVKPHCRASAFLHDYDRRDAVESRDGYFCFSICEDSCAHASVCQSCLLRGVK